MSWETIAAMLHAGMNVPLFLAGLAGVVWLVRLEARIAAHETVCTERQREAAETRARVELSLRRIEDRLDRIDRS